MKKEKALWKKGSAHLPTKLIPVFSVFPVVAFLSRIFFAVVSIHALHYSSAH